MKGWTSASSQSIKIESIQNVAESQNIRRGELAVQTQRGTYHVSGLDTRSINEVKEQILLALERVHSHKAKDGQELNVLIKKLINIELRRQWKEKIITKKQYEEELEK
jgi:hypothetical protein